MGMPEVESEEREDPRAPRPEPGRQAGVYIAKLASHPGDSPGYLLGFSLGCRCQGVGNWGLPGGVMLFKHPPATLTTRRIWHSAKTRARAKTAFETSGVATGGRPAAKLGAAG